MIWRSTLRAIRAPWIWSWTKKMSKTFRSQTTLRTMGSKTSRKTKRITFRVQINKSIKSWGLTTMILLTMSNPPMKWERKLRCFMDWSTKGLFRPPKASTKWNQRWWKESLGTVLDCYVRDSKWFHGANQWNPTWPRSRCTALGAKTSTSQSRRSMKTLMEPSLDLALPTYCKCVILKWFLKKARSSSRGFR